MKTSKAQLKAVERYNKEKTTTICIRLNKETDKDIIELINSIPNKQGLIKDLLRDYIYREYLYKQTKKALKLNNNRK